MTQDRTDACSQGWNAYRGLTQGPRLVMRAGLHLGQPSDVFSAKTSCSCCGLSLFFLFVDSCLSGGLSWARIAMSFSSVRLRVRAPLTAPDKSALRSYHHFHGENQFYDHNKEQRVPTNCGISLPRSKQRSLAMCTSYHLQLCEEKTAVQVARDLRVHDKA